MFKNFFKKKTREENLGYEEDERHRDLGCPTILLDYLDFRVFCKRITGEEQKSPWFDDEEIYPMLAMGDEKNATFITAKDCDIVLQYAKLLENKKLGNYVFEYQR